MFVKHEPPSPQYISLNVVGSQPSARHAFTGLHDVLLSSLSPKTPIDVGLEHSQVHAFFANCLGRYIMFTWQELNNHYKCMQYQINELSIDRTLGNLRI